VEHRPMSPGGQQSPLDDFGASKNNKLLPHKLAVSYRHEIGRPPGKLTLAPFMVPLPSPRREILMSSLRFLCFISS